VHQASELGDAALPSRTEPDILRRACSHDVPVRALRGTAVGSIVYSGGRTAAPSGGCVASECDVRELLTLPCATDAHGPADNQKLRWPRAICPLQGQRGSLERNQHGE
jgi:hypothetical protein